MRRRVGFVPARRVELPFDPAVLESMVEAHGCPLITELPGDPSSVVATFCRAPSSPPAWIYLDATGLTDRDAFDEALLAPVAGSTPSRSAPSRSTPSSSALWSISLVVPADWRGAYSFVESTEAAGPEGAVDEQRRAWWLTRLAQSQADPFNRQPPFRSARGGMRSEGVMPAAPPQRWVPAHADAAPPILTQRHERTLGGCARDVWTMVTGAGSEPRTAVILFDGRVWAEQMPVAPSLMALSEAGALPPLAVAMVDSVNPERRAAELPGVASFADEIVDTLLPWMQETLGATPGAGTAIAAGQSFGGLAAATVALRHPAVVGRAIIQSGSFWHPPGWGDAPGEGAATWQGVLGEVDRSGTRFWIEAGIREGDMYDLSRDFAERAGSAGATVTLRGYCGGHDVVHWRAGLLDGLIDLLGR